MKKVSVEFDLTEKHEAALEELLPYWKQYEGEGGSRPFANYTIEDVFKAIMQVGSWHMIWKKIKEEQYREGKITADEWLDYEEKTIAEREADRQQAKKEGACE